MNAANGMPDFAPTVYGTDGLDLIEPPPGRNAMTVDDVLVFAEEFADQGFDLGPKVAKARAIWDAARAVFDFDLRAEIETIDVDTVDPSEVADLVTSAALAHTARTKSTFFDRVNDSGIERTTEILNESLTRVVTLALREDADRIVEQLRPKFDEALTVITAAHKQGITNQTKRDDLLADGTQTAIKAWRAVPAAVAELDRVAKLRLDLAQRLNYRPATSFLADVPDVAAFIRNVPDEMSLNAAESAWLGDTEMVNVKYALGGYAMKEVRKPRHGGAWLELLERGYDVHLNTALETAEVVRAAEQNRAPVGAKAQR